jgi:transposase, IS6 family
LSCLGLGFGSFHTARQTLAGFETMAMMRKGQLQKMDGHHIRGQAVVIADLFDSAASAVRARPTTPAHP